MKPKINFRKLNYFRSLLLAISLAVSFTLVSCEVILDAIIECIINIHPDLPDQLLTEGYFGEPYHDEIKASMINEPYNDDYYYYFNISGKLPDGIVIYADGRTLFIEGTPMESGRYLIKIDLEVEPYDVETILCNDSAYKEYVLIVTNN